MVSFPLLQFYGVLMRKNFLTPEDSRNLALLQHHFEYRVVIQLGNQWKLRDPNLDRSSPTAAQRSFGTVCMLIAAFVLTVWPPLTTMTWMTGLVLTALSLILFLQLLSELSAIRLWQRTLRFPYQMEYFAYKREHVRLILQYKTPVDAWFVSLVILIATCYFACWPLFLATISICGLAHLRKRYAAYAYKHALVVLAVQ